MSPRTFARQFVRQNGTTPHQWLMHQRVLAARRRLEKTAESIDQVAAAVGLGSAATLRVHFARALGTSPAAYRRRFSTATTGRVETEPPSRGGRRGHTARRSRN
jgi:transcriptional regulator GlxA family with amidase domain